MAKTPVRIVKDVRVHQTTTPVMNTDIAETIEVTEEERNSRVLAVTQQVVVKTDQQPRLEFRQEDTQLTAIVGDRSVAVSERQHERLKTTYRGERGERGEQGEKGDSIEGPQGERGEKGESIIGPRGDRGDKGDKGDSVAGPQGDRGERGEVGRLQTYIYSAPTASHEWLIRHDLAAYPKVTVVDSAGTVFEADVQYIDINTLVVRFAYAMGGIAYLG